jgi:hypothetical protein
VSETQKAPTLYEQSFNLLKQFPHGLTVRQFEDLCINRNDKRSASARLSQFVAEQLAIKVTGQGLAVYVPTGREFAERVLPKRDKRRARKRPTDTELVELRQWKADAIRRFPELGVPPHVATARERVAAIFRAQGCEIKAVMAASGELDETETMRVVITMLSPEMAGPKK